MLTEKEDRQVGRTAGQVKEMVTKADKQSEQRNTDEYSTRQGVRRIFRQGQKRGQALRCTN